MSWLKGLVAAAVLAAVLAPAAQASSFVTAYMEAHVVDSPNAWVSWYPSGTVPVLAVSPGQTIEYRLMVLWTGTMGTTNAKGTVDPANDITITSLNPSGNTFGGAIVNGINSVKFNVYEAATNPLQVNFATTSTLSAADGWTGNTGWSGGNATARTGATGYYDLLGVRAIQSVGYYVGLPGGTPAPVLLSTGTATVGGVFSKTTDSTILMSHYSPVNGSGYGSAIRINNPAVAVTESYLWAGGPTFDPLTVYNGITMYQPWADATISNIPTDGYAVDPTKGEDLLLTANVGGSGHTVAHYRWTINSETSLVYDTLVPMLEVSAEDLNKLSGEHHTITLSVTTDDGQSATSAAAPLTLLPEPATLCLLGFGALAILRRRRAA